MKRLDQLGIFFGALRGHTDVKIVHADLIRAVPYIHAVFFQQESLKVGGGHAAFDLDEHEVGPRGIYVDSRDRPQIVVELTNVADQSSPGFVIYGVSGRQQGQKILRQRIHIPGGNELPHAIQNKKISAVAVSKAQARHAAMLAHAPHQQQIGELVSNLQQARDGVTGEVDNDLMDND